MSNDMKAEWKKKKKKQVNKQAKKRGSDKSRARVLENPMFQ